LYEPPYDERGLPSDEICPCCGFHFGYDDDEVQDKKLYMYIGEKSGYRMDVNGFQRVGTPMEIGMQRSN
jgi:hypothetical protein